MSNRMIRDSTCSLLYILIHGAPPCSILHHMYNYWCFSAPVSPTLWNEPRSTKGAAKIRNSFDRDLEHRSCTTVSIPKKNLKYVKNIQIPILNQDQIIKDH